MRRNKSSVLHKCQLSDHFGVFFCDVEGKSRFVRLIKNTLLMPLGMLVLLSTDQHISRIFSVAVVLDFIGLTIFLFILFLTLALAGHFP